MGKKKKPDQDLLCDHPDHPEYHGKICLCWSCRPEHYYCIEYPGPCYDCDGPVAVCNYDPDED